VFAKYRIQFALVIILLVASMLSVWLMLQIWLGGAPNQTRLAETFMDRVKLDKLESVLEPLFYMWKTERHEKEGFGDFIYRQVLIYLLCFDWDQKGGRMSFNFGPHALFRI
jgi:hypothetical protein